MKRIDLGNFAGPFQQLIIRPIIEGQYELRKLERDFAKRWAELGDYKNLRKKIENPLFFSPKTQMYFGDAKKSLAALVTELRRLE